MRIKIEYTNKAIKELTKLSRSDAQKIVKKIDFYATQKDPLVYAKKLKPPFNNLFRFRVGEYRVIFNMDNDGNMTIFIVLGVKHRKDVYKD